MELKRVQRLNVITRYFSGPNPQAGGQLQLLHTSVNDGSVERRARCDGYLRQGDGDRDRDSAEVILRLQANIPLPGPKGTAINQGTKPCIPNLRYWLDLRGAAGPSIFA
jgi:hypothetical protein